MTRNNCDWSVILTQINRLWREGRDTMGIARKLKMKEWEVYNLLSKARNSGKAN